jgi:hypothetical protein
MIGLKNRLDQLATSAEGSGGGVSILLEIREIKLLTSKIAEKWLQ